MLQTYSESLRNLKQVESSRKSASDLTEVTLRFSFKAMYNVNAMVNKDQIRSKILDDLVRNPENIKLSSKILTDNDFAKSHFSDDQAISRVYAIQLLRYLADRGDLEPLQDTTRQLVEILSVKNSVAAGEWRDLEDLVTHTIEAMQPRSVLDNLDEILQNLSYTSSVPEIKTSFRNAFYFAMVDSIPKEDFDKVMKKLKSKI